MSGISDEAFLSNESMHGTYWAHQGSKSCAPPLSVCNGMHIKITLLLLSVGMGPEGATEIVDETHIEVKHRRKHNPCIHGKWKHRCKECCPNSFCRHEKRKDMCKACNGSAFCEHRKRKIICKQCNADAFCAHDRLRYQCKKCGGVGICEHMKRKTKCMTCGGSEICEHMKQKSHCKTCDGRALCKTPLCEVRRSNPNYKGHCLFCFMHLFPDEKVARNYKTKETTVAHHVKERFPVIDWTCDKTIQGGCSRRRPDMLADLGSHVVIVEVDEHRHDEYECICENRRIMEISKDLGHRPVVCIRFNPDAYVGLDGAKVASPWRQNSVGANTVMKSHQAAWDERLSALSYIIAYWMIQKPEKMVEVIELYY